MTSNANVEGDLPKKLGIYLNFFDSIWLLKLLHILLTHRVFDCLSSIVSWFREIIFPHICGSPMLHFYIKTLRSANLSLSGCVKTRLHLQFVQHCDNKYAHRSSYPPAPPHLVLAGEKCAKRDGESKEKLPWLMVMGQRGEIAARRWCMDTSSTVF